MMVIIIGQNRAELAKVPRRDQDKHFFKTKGQLYKVYPDGLSRMRIYDADGVETDSEEVIVYAENEVVPYHPRNVAYDIDTLLSDIDKHKMMAPRTIFPYRIYFTEARNIWRGIAPMFPMIVAGIVLLYAFIG